MFILLLAFAGFGPSLVRCGNIDEEVTRIAIREAVRTELEVKAEFEAIIQEVNSRADALQATTGELRNQVEVEAEARQQDAVLFRQSMEEERALREQMQRDMGWYSLTVAAAAACRGSTPTGGSGPWGNAVLAKENTKSCEVCFIEKSGE